MNAQEMDPLDHVKEHLDTTDDPTLLILRVHLLVEERLRDLLARICRSPDELPPARLSFYQVLYLCRAVVGRHDDPAWGFVARLNEVRNRMAHRLDPGDVDTLLGSVVEKLGVANAGKTETPIERLRAAAFYACGYFDAIRGSAKLGRAYDAEEVSSPEGRRKISPVARAPVRGESRRG